MPFDQRLLAAFDAVATTGGVGRAATELNTTQPTISRHVQALERQIGQPLFDRGSQGMHLTAAGADLLPHARLLLQEMRLAEEMLDAHRGLKRGSVRVGAAAAVAEFFLPAIVATVAQRAPHLRTEVLVASEDRLERALANREVDLIFATEAPREIDAVPVGTRSFTDRCTSFCATDHPLLRKGAVSLHHVLGEAWAMPPPQATPRRQFERLVREAGLETPRIALETDSVELILAVVSRSAMIGWLPEPILRKIGTCESVQMLDVPGLDITRTFRPYRRATGTFPAAARAFIDAMAEGPAALSN